MGSNRDGYLVIKEGHIADGLYPLALLRFLYTYGVDLGKSIPGTSYKVRSYYYMLNSLDRGIEDKVDLEFKHDNLAELREVLLGEDKDAKLYINESVKIGINDNGNEVIATPKLPDNKFEFKTGEYVGKKIANTIGVKLTLAGVDGTFREMDDRLYGVDLSCLGGSAAYEFLLNCNISNIESLLVLRKLCINCCKFVNIRDMQINTLYNLSDTHFRNCRIKCKYINFGVDNKFVGCNLEVEEVVNLYIEKFALSELIVKDIKNLVVQSAESSVFKFNKYLDYNSIIGNRVVDDDDNMTFEEGEFCKFLDCNHSDCEYYFYGGVDERGMKKWLDNDEPYARNVYYFNSYDYARFKNYSTKLDINRIQ